MPRLAPLLASLLAASPALAVPLQLAHQGRLLDTVTGAPLDGDREVTVTLYDAPAGGAAVWSESMDLAFTDGYFAVILGADAANPLDVADLAEPLYLAMAIDG